MKNKKNWMENGFPLEELKEGLLKAREADRDLQYFGAKTHQYQWNTPALLAEVEALEQKIGITLPEEYREFLLQAGDGGAGPYYGLFSIKQVCSWLNWEVHPKKEPWFYPGMKVPKEEEALDYNKCRYGCIPIASLGDSYFLYLLVSGPNRGRLVYVEEELLYIFFPREESFLAWYTRWLREVANGYRIFWFGTNLDGDEKELCQCYNNATTEDERQLVLESMEKFPSFSKETAVLIERAAKDFIGKTDTRLFIELLNRISPQKKDAYLEFLWEKGFYDAVVSDVDYTIRYFHEQEQAVLEQWGLRILSVLPRISHSLWYTAFQILPKCPQIQLSDVIDFWEIAEQKNKPELIRAFARFKDAREHLAFFLDFLDEREDVELLNAAVIAVPQMADKVLLEKLTCICEDLEFSMEYREEDSEECQQRRSDQALIYRNACQTKRAIEELILNPLIDGVPRPHILRLIPDQPWKKKEEYMHDDFAIHPLIALVLQDIYGRLPSTKWEWNHLLEKLQKLYLILDKKYILSDLDRCHLHLKKPDEYGVPDKTYRYDINDWSSIGRMKNLHTLKIEQICVNDFSFLTQCQNLQKLSLYNTNFTDCRLLSSLPKLTFVDLRYCRLEHTEVLEGMEVLT